MGRSFLVGLDQRCQQVREESVKSSVEAFDDRLPGQISRFARNPAMTQLLLFDAPSHGPVAVADSSVVPLSESPASLAVEETQSVGISAANVGSRLECESGLHHMGDLARLVLLRYDLMAQRRLKNRRKADKKGLDG